MSDAKFTPREMQVLPFIVDGQSLHYIGAHLGISFRTAEYHVHRIIHKLGVVNRVQAAVKIDRMQREAV
jgi:DNA-binding NarL/FixJ family response regulator